MSNLIKVKTKTSLIDSLPKNSIPAHHFSPAELLKIEKEIMGIYAHAHPLSLYREELASQKGRGQILIQSHHIEQLRAGLPILIAGLLIQVRRQFTRHQQVMAFLLLEDETGLFEAIAFPEVFRNYFSFLVKEALLLIKGKVGDKNGEEKIIIQEIKNLHSCLQINIPGINL
ncbi:MAG: OB-fold nucleic acid binding domain-containing protein [Atribacterota bacterium]|jgi:DNA polymerase-3 subunit alpha|nr:OB-fold nucleic acid binding domain-containing protein [Atribacterota bacterium]MDD4895765.1 OB-fold nucleic acid binding domain-containing protein [Atribacterota bacterium]MDD5637139.1 OB-fold nucleic acid binding domain-containing protein [Atribacterota bacterium]